MTNTNGHAEIAMLLNMCARLRNSNALRRNRMHYAVEAHTIVEIYALFLPMNALCRIVEIGCTISEIRTDCLYLDGKKV